MILRFLQILLKKEHKKSGKNPAYFYNDFKSINNI